MSECKDCSHGPTACGPVCGCYCNGCSMERVVKQRDTAQQEVKRLRIIENVARSIQRELKDQQGRVSIGLEADLDDALIESHEHLLGEALRKLLVRLGVLHADAVCSGPELIVAAEIHCENLDG